MKSCQNVFGGHHFYVVNPQLYINANIIQEQFDSSYYIRKHPANYEQLV